MPQLELLAFYMPREKAEALVQGINDSFIYEYESPYVYVLTSCGDGLWYNIYVDWSLIPEEDRKEFRYPMACYTNGFVDGWKYAY